MKYSAKRKHGAVRDAIVDMLSYRATGASVADITREVSARIGETPASSIRSYLRLNTPRLFTKVDRGYYRVREEAQATLSLPDAPLNFSEGQGESSRRSQAARRAAFRLGNATLVHDDCFRWLANSASNSIEAVVTDPPYGLIEYSEEEQIKMRNGHGAFGAFHLRSMETKERRCRGSRFCRATTLLR